jgi:hypothetical protein
MNQDVVIRPFTPAAAMAGPSRRRVAVWGGLLWSEWFAHSRLLLLFLIAWLGFVWVLPFLAWLLPWFAHPGWILLLGGVYALVAGPAYGGGDIIEGCEEFSFTLPVTRVERYVARLVVGVGSLLIFTVMDLLALGLDLSQALARLYVDTGLIKPLQVAQPGLLYGLVLAFPFALFAFSFTWAAVTHSRVQVFTAWFWGGLGALVVLRVGFQYEQLMWDKLNGLLTCPLLLALGVVALAGGCWQYQRKEVGPSVAPLQLPVHWWLWTLLFLLGLALALFLIAWLAREVPAFLTGG